MSGIFFLTQNYRDNGPAATWLAQSGAGLFMRGELKFATGRGRNPVLNQGPSGPKPDRHARHPTSHS
jgi:hypothetical protein